MHVSYIYLIDPQNNNFLSWKLKEDLPVHIGLPYMQYFARKWSSSTAGIFFIHSTIKINEPFKGLISIRLAHCKQIVAKQEHKESDFNQTKLPSP